MILVFGKTGQVATELRKRLPNAIFLDRNEADLTDPEACAAQISKNAPAVVINAAAYTAVDQAESDEETATLVNGTSPTRMAEACAGLGIPFIHISTDYVFDGAGEVAFTPDHPTAPLGAYGRTKLLGETGIINAAGTYIILRTSWVFSCHGNNFMKSMLRLGSERDALSIVADQIGGPTPAGAIADACIAIIDQIITAPEKSGIYHFSGTPDVSWADFSRVIFDKSDINCTVNDIPTSAYPTPAKRPSNSRMNCKLTTEAFGIDRPDWAKAVSTALKELEHLQ